MTSKSDDLEQALQENLKLRSELAANVAKAKSGGSQRISRGFHRLGLFAAAICVSISSATLIYMWLAGGSISWSHLLITLAVSLVMYGLIRAIDWVIGGFTA